MPSVGEEGRYGSANFVDAKIDILLLLLWVVVSFSSQRPNPFPTPRLTFVPIFIYHDFRTLAYFVNRCTCTSPCPVSQLSISMERHSSKRKHHGQPHQSNANRESERHRPSGTENGAYGDSKRRSVHHELRKETLAKPPLSRDDDYVQRWLAQNDKEIEMDTNRPGTQEKKTG